MLLSRDPQTVELHRQALRPGLRLNPIEANGGVIPDEETDAVIRTVLAADVSEMAASLPRLRGRRALPEIAPQDEVNPRTARRIPKMQHRDMRPSEMLANEIPATSMVETTESDTTQQVRPAKTGRTGWVKPALMMALGVAVLLRPVLILLPMFLAFWGLMLFVAVLGGGSFGEGYGRIYRWQKTRSPERAERLRLRLDRLAERVDGLLDRLPSRWADAMALPDFSRAALDPDLNDDRPDPFERIAFEGQGH